jgi:hypothetical protein
MFEEGPK